MKIVRLTESQLKFLSKVISEQNVVTPDFIKTKSQEIQTELNNLTNQIKGKTIKIDNGDFLINNMKLSKLSQPRKKENYLEGEIQISYSETNKSNPQVIVSNFYTKNNPMVSNEFISLFDNSFGGSRPAQSPELLNHLNNIISKIFTIN